jgi:hypothetical protein
VQPDLSIHSTPITEEIINSKRVELSESQISFFEQNGYVSGVDILTPRQIELLRLELEGLMRPDQASNQLFYEYHLNESEDDRILFHALGAWRVSTAFHDLVFHPAIKSVAEQLLGGQVRLWHDQLFVKPAYDGAVVAWHQDYSYWTRSVPIAHLTCWIALDDATVENGCLHYVPGSHKWNLLPRAQLGSDMEATLKVLTEEQRKEFRPVPAELRAGSVTFHHPLMVHGSYENRSDRPRRGAVVNLIRNGVTSDSDEPLLAGVPVIKKGERIDGRFFPLL